MRKTVYGMHGIRPHRSGETVWVWEEMAERQERKFREAGYTRVVTEAVFALVAKDGLQAFLVVDQCVVQIAQMPITIKPASAIAGKAAVISVEHPPVIRVVDDLPIWQKIAVALITMCMGAWPGVLIAAIVMKSFSVPIGDQLPGLLLGGLVSAIIMIVIRPLFNKAMEAGMWVIGINPKVGKSES